MRGKEKRDTHGGGGGYSSSRRDYQDEGYRYCIFNGSVLLLILSWLNKFNYACLRFLLAEISSKQVIKIGINKERTV